MVKSIKIIYAALIVMLLVCVASLGLQLQGTASSKSIDVMEISGPIEEEVEVDRMGDMQTIINLDEDTVYKNDLFEEDTFINLNGYDMGGSIRTLQGVTISIEDRNLTYTSSNPNVIVIEDGNFVAVGPGECDIHDESHKEIIHISVE